MKLACSFKPIFTSLVVCLLLVGGVLSIYAEMGWKNNIYGVAEVWGLYYNDPWTSSSHRVYVENAQDNDITYKYECNHSLVDLGGGWVADDTIEPHGSIDEGDPPVWHHEGQYMNLDSKNVPRGVWYFLSCYTRLDVDGDPDATWESGVVTIGPFHHQD